MPRPDPDALLRTNLRMRVVEDQPYVHLDDLAAFLRTESIVVVEKHRLKPRFLAPLLELLGLGTDQACVRAGADVLVQIADKADRWRRELLADYEASKEEG